MFSLSKTSIVVLAASMLLISGAPLNLEAAIAERARRTVEDDIATLQAENSVMQAQISVLQAQESALISSVQEAEPVIVSQGLQIAALSAGQASVETALDGVQTSIDDNSRCVHGMLVHQGSGYTCHCKNNYYGDYCDQAYLIRCTSDEHHYIQDMFHDLQGVESVRLLEIHTPCSLDNLSGAFAHTSQVDSLQIVASTNSEISMTPLGVITLFNLAISGGKISASTLEGLDHGNFVALSLKNVHVFGSSGVSVTFGASPFQQLTLDVVSGLEHLNVSQVEDNSSTFVSISYSDDLKSIDLGSGNNTDLDQFRINDLPALESYSGFHSIATVQRDVTVKNLPSLTSFDSMTASTLTSVDIVDISGLPQNAAVASDVAAIETVSAYHRWVTLPCMNGGTSVTPSGASTYCNCPSGYEGFLCQTSV